MKLWNRESGGDDLTVNRDGSQNVTVTVTSDFTKTFDALKDKEITVDIRKASKGRSISQNAFMWSLCSEIGKSINAYITEAKIRGAKRFLRYSELSFGEIANSLAFSSQAIFRRSSKKKPG